MRLGIALPQLGPFADPQLIAPFAAQAESLGFDSLWASERVHAPTHPLTSYPGGDGSMPDEFRRSVDPLLALTVAASATSTPRLGTSTLSAPLHPPIVLARSLAGIDRLSGGRLNVGFGLSWMRDEYDAVAVPWRERGPRLDETLDVLEALWSPDPVRHEGRFWSVSEGEFQPKPAQPRPPIYLGGFSAPALHRVGQRADGWLGIALPLDTLRSTLHTLERAAADSGRAVDTILRINPRISETPTGPFDGPVEHLCAYLRQLADLGVAEAFVDLQYTTHRLAEMLDLAARIRAGYAN